METGIQTKIQTEPQPEVKTTKCLNCGIEFEGKFCPECGQNADTGRFTWRFIIENLQSAIMGKDGGIWFTVKNLFSRPGTMIVEILNGKRKSYFSPFPMLFFVLAIYVLILSFTGSNDAFREFENELLQPESSENVEVELSFNGSEIVNLDSDKAKSYVSLLLGKAFSIYNNHYTAIFMLTLPFFLFATRVWYGKNNRKRYFRAEYIVAITYSMVMVVLYQCLVSLAYLFSPNVSDSMSDWIPIVITVAFTACFRKMLGFSIAKTAWRSLLAVVLYYIIMGFVLISSCIVVYFILRRNLVIGS